jgi:hypothetical protein
MKSLPGRLLAQSSLMAAACLVFFACLAQAACPGGAVRLQAPNYYDVGGMFPGSSAIGDFDSDGVRDIVTAVGGYSYGDGRVAFQHGRGDGTFGSPMFTEAGAGRPLGLVAGDFNSDGKLDVAVTANGSASVLILLGQGNGTFAIPVAYAAGDQPHHILAADFNHDGILDLAIGCAHEFSVSVLLGNGSAGHGNGTFGARTAYALNNYCTGVEAGDVNGDGIVDLLATEYTSGTVAILLGNGFAGAGDGTFAKATHLASPGVVYDVTLSDLDLDGRLDLLVAKSGEGLDAHRGLAGGAFGPAIHLLDGVIGGAKVADYDADGQIDIAYANPTSNAVGILHGNGFPVLGTGSFTFQLQRYVGPFPVLLASSDLNSDGNTDLVVDCYNSTQIAVCLVGCTPAPPFQIQYVRDVSGDEGGHVWVSWAAHYEDVPNGAVLGYDIMRRAPGTFAWERAGSMAADHSSGYIASFTTTQDSTAGGNPYTSFRVDALFASPGGFQSTPVDSGYSVDNRAPAPPTMLRALVANGRVQLNWAANTEPDLAGYVLHRGTSPYFHPTADNLIGQPTEPAFLDPTGSLGSYYLLAAVDVHGNLSQYVLIQAVSAPGFAIEYVRDVPGDEGGHATVAWGAHPQDVPNGVVRSYDIMRRAPGSLDWELVGSLQASRMGWYSVDVATAQDSTPVANPYTSFRIDAQRILPSGTYSTAVDSGYSVDNIAPTAPTRAEGVVVNGLVVLSWAGNTEADLAGYRVHRGPDRFFTATAANLIGQPTDTTFTDPDGVAGSFYLLAAVDVHGNVGPYVLIEPNMATGIEQGLVSFEATPAGVTLTWYADAHAIAFATLERASAPGEWNVVASGTPDASGLIVFHDTDVRSGATYAYRLAWTASDGAHVSASTSVIVPALALALNGAWPNPAASAELAIRFALRDASPASLELFDVSGRRLVQREVGGMGAGTHVLDLAAARLRGGVYLVRLSQHGEERRTRIIVL